jgi:anti-anti-sigma factor
MGTHLLVREDDSTLVVAGEVDMSTAGMLWVTINATFGPGEDARLDLTDVTFIDSSGISVLLRAARERELRVTGASRQVQRVLDMAGLIALFGLTGGDSSR